MLAVRVIIDVLHGHGRSMLIMACLPGLAEYRNTWPSMLCSLDAPSHPNHALGTVAAWYMVAVETAVRLKLPARHLGICQAPSFSGSKLRSQGSGSPRSYLSRLLSLGG